MRTRDAILAANVAVQEDSGVATGSVRPLLREIFRGFVLLVVAAAGVSSCGSNTTPTASLAVTCTPTTVSLYNSGSTGMFSSCKAVLNGSDVTSTAVWSTSNSAVATVSAGSVQPVGVGVTTISASAQGVSASATITVNDAFTLNVQPTGLLTIEGATSAGLVIDTGGPSTPHPALSANWGDGLTSSVTAGTSGLVGCNEIDRCVEFSHTYQTTGIFPSTVTASVSSPTQVVTTFTVTSLTGTWIAGTGTDGCTGQRTLVLVQTGLSLAGTYTNPTGSQNSLSGTIASGGTVTVNV